MLVTSQTRQKMLKLPTFCSRWVCSLALVSVFLLTLAVVRHLTPSLKLMRHPWVELPADRAEMYKSLASLVRSKPVVVEIGVYRGVNAVNLLKIIRPGKLILADLWAETDDERYKSANEDIVKNLFAGEIRKAIVYVRKGPSLSTIAALATSSVDILYLDTTHDYLLTRRELPLAARVVSPTGFLCGHDFVQPVGKEFKYGVIAAVLEFALTADWRITHISQETHRSFCLQRRKL
jgi:hypothetical protein